MRTLKRKLNKINNIALHLEEWILILLMIVTFVIMLAQIFWKTILDAPLVWSEEFTRHLLVQEVLIGLAYAVGKDIHIEFSYFVEKVHGKVLIALKLLKYLIEVGVMVFLFWDSILYIQSQMSILSPTMGYMMGWVWIIFPISSAFVTLHGVTNIVNTIAGAQEE